MCGRFGAIGSSSFTSGSSIEFVLLILSRNSTSGMELFVEASWFTVEDDNGTCNGVAVGVDKFLWRVLSGNNWSKSLFSWL